MADTSSTVTSVSDRRSPESSLLDHVGRVAHSRSGRFAVQIHLSQLRPHNRKPHHIRIAARSFDSVLNSAESNLYVLSSNDLVLICKDVRIEDIDLVIDKLCSLFRNDPLTAGGRRRSREEFTSWFDFEIEYDTFLQNVREMADGQSGGLGQTEDASAGRGLGMGFVGEALDPFSLAKVNDSLNRTRVDDMIQQQPAVIIGADGTERILFQENYLSIAELQRRIAPGYNLISNQWLFQHLTQTVDRRILATLIRDDYETLAEPISINLNIATVLSNDFKRFDEVVAEFTEKVVIELQQIDVFSDLDNFYYTRNWLKDRGYRVLLDGLNPVSLHYFDPGLLEADFYKVGWGLEFTETESAQEHDDIGEAINKIGAERFIVARAETEESVRWALTFGIRRFQGYFIDELVQRQIEKEGHLAGPTNKQVH
ncbi:MAG: EAL domain-containing protein [Rhodospirillaceae bacterium]|jgi:EAL domain-containing protein (putative c-di-GMP-specific phosphodiesterase class I)|nr:EAL domain-containing protein [Rhodospirillaceae bacterium]MBT4589504.1 EAL domain-containing protein [Rhodospirillaceae bacterium]MBT7267873.1 EAL domain-containing protein [Rhodospirillaceae bacterium]